MARVVFFLIGLLLSVTAILKLWMLMTDPFSDIITGMASELTWFIALVETAVVLVLLSEVSRKVKAIGVIVLFLGFLGGACIRLSMGSATCGCFGYFSASPMMAALLDGLVILVMVFLLVHEIRLGKRNERNQWLSGITKIPSPAFALGFVAAVFLWTLTYTSTADGFLGIFRIPPAVIASAVDLGDRRVNESPVCQIQLTNRSHLPVRIVGSQKSCGCLLLEEVSKTIPPNGTVTCPVLVRLQNTGLFRQRVMFLLDSKRQFSVAVDITGNVF